METESTGNYMYAEAASTNREHDIDVWEMATPREVEDDRLPLLHSPAVEQDHGNIESSYNRRRQAPKLKRLTGAQRRQALKAKLAKQGRVYHSKKSRTRYKSEKLAEQSQNRGWHKGFTEPNESNRTNNDFSWCKPSGHTDTIKTGSTTVKIAVIPPNYPTVKFSEEERALVQLALIAVVDSLEDGHCAQLANSYVERGAVILACMNQKTADWVLSTAPKLEPWEGAELLAGYRSVLLQKTQWFQ